ncbi:HEAT repeat domain-containing protein [Leucobacter sp.]
MASIDEALAAPDPSARLQAALTAGTHPHPGDARALIRRCGEEPDFFVRDMLTWALTRHPRGTTVPLLLAELGSPIPQARAQALHTLSKIGDARAWPAITDEMLHDADDEVARTAWRTAAGLVPAGGEAALAGRLAGELGRGDREMRRSLARAFVELGAAAEPVLREAARRGSRAERLQAAVALVLIRDPESGFEAALHDAERELASRDAASPRPDPVRATAPRASAPRADGA